MLENFGQKIRTLRKQKGISLNALAKALDISPAYLSNLENGKTETINLTFLKKFEAELSVKTNNLFNTQKENTESFDQFHFRIEKAMSSLKELNAVDPGLTKYILTIVEQGIDLKKEGHSLHDYQ